jgi:hypothetical protein
LVCWLGTFVYIRAPLVAPVSQVTDLPGFGPL